MDSNLILNLETLRRSIFHIYCRPSDYFQGEIKLKNVVVSKVYGTFCGFIEFNNIRYWDVRENLEVKVNKIFIKIIEPATQLPSAAIYREDRILIEKSTNLFT